MFEGTQFLANRPQRLVHFLVTICLGPPLGVATLLAEIAASRDGSPFPNGAYLLMFFELSYVLGFVPAVLSAFLSNRASKRTTSFRVHLLLSPAFGGISTLLFVLLMIVVQEGRLESPTPGGAAMLASLGAAAALGTTVIAYAVSKATGFSGP